MRQEDQKPWDEADQFRIGGRLFSEVKASIDRGEAPPQELRDALAQFQEQAAAMAHVQDPERSDAWYGLWQSIEGGLQEAIAPRQRSDNLQDYLPKPGPGGRGFERRITPKTWEIPEPPSSMKGRLFELSPEALRAHSILNAESRIDEAGREVVEDSEGETWDISEALATFRNPKVRRSLAQSMQNVVPGHPAIANTLGSMGAYQMLLRGAGKLDEKITGAPQVANLRTAQPGLVLPWTIPEVPDLDEKLRDPVWTRGLKQVMAEMEQAGEVQPGTLETFLRVGFGLVDFMAFSKALSSGLQLAGKGALAAGVKATTVPGMAATALAKGRSATTFPRNTHFGRMAGDFIAYEVGTKTFDDRTTVPEDVWHGFEQAAVFKGLGFLASVTRGLAQRFGGSALAHRLAPSLGPGKPASMQPFDRLYESVRKFPKPGLTEGLDAQVRAPHIKEAIKKGIDAYLTGVYSHAYGEAKDAEPGGAFKAFWRGLFGSHAQVTGLAFALGSGLQASVETRKGVNAFMRSEAGQKTLRAIAERMASPLAGENHREIWRQMDEWRDAEPELFEGLVKRTARRQEIVQRRGAAKQVATAITGWHPEEGPPAETEAVRTLPELGESALERFKEAERISDAALAAGGKAAVRPTFTVGEVPEQTLKDIGFSGYNHALNAVREYLRVVERNTETKIGRLKDVPKALWLRTLDWRDRQKTFPGELRGESVPSLLDVLRAREIPPEERQPVQGLTTSKAGEQLGEQGALAERQPGAPKKPGSELVARPVPDRAPSATPRTIGEAAALVEATEAHPAYRGLSPLEAVAKASAKARAKRPGLGRALELVSSGKKTVEWLKETYPEGAHKVGTGPAESWIGEFQTAVRRNWAARPKEAARAVRTQAQAGNFHGKPADIITWIKAMGGIRTDAEYGGEFASFTIKEAGRRRSEAPGEEFLGPIAHPKGSKRGMYPDSMREAAEERGFIPPNSGLGELLEAVEATLRGDRRFASGGGGYEALAKSELENLERIHGEQLAFERSKLESGESALPDDPAARRKLIAEAFAGDPRFDNLTPERQERQLLELRSQAEAGDPGAMLAAPLETVQDKTLAAAAKYRRLVDDLKALDALDIESSPQSEGAMAAVMQLVAGKPHPAIPTAQHAEYVARARALRAAQRDAARSLLDENKELGAGVKANMNALWDAIDARLEGRRLPSETKAHLKKLGWLDEFGEVSTHWEEKAQNHLAELLWCHTRRFEEPGEAVFSGAPMPLAFRGRKFTRVEEGGIGGILSWQRLYEVPWFQNATQSKVGRKLFKLFVDIGALPGLNVFNTGPLSRPQDAATREAVRVNMLYRGLLGSRMRTLEVRMGAAVAETFAAFGGRRMPQDHSDFFDWGHSSGFFQNARGPADLERVKKGTGYLWPVYTKARDLFEEVAKPALALGVMTPAQYEAWGKGKYLTQVHIREELERDAESLGRGEMPLVGRSMLREHGRPDPTEALFKSNDAPHQMMKGISDWARVLRVVGDWWHPIELGQMRSQAEVDAMHPLAREDYARAGVRIAPSAGRSFEQELHEMGRTGEWDPSTLVLSARLQKLEKSMAKPGEEPEPGRMGYSPELAKLVRSYLDEGRYLPKSIMWEMDIASSELFAMPGDSTMAKVGHGFDLFGGFTKRGFTALRPAAITLDYLSSAVNNHVGRGVPIWDFLAGHLGIPSFTSDGLRDGSLYGRWVSEGAPKERPAAWTSGDWNDVMRANKYMEAAGYSSSVFAVIGPEIAHLTGQFADNLYSMKSALLAQLEREAAKHNWTVSQKDRLEASVLDVAKRRSRGLERVDMKIAEWLGDADPAAHAKAVAMYAAYRQLAEVFVFKYPAFLKAKHEWPEASYSRLIEYSTEKTSNYADTNPSLRRWLSMVTPWNDKTWQAAQGSWKVPLSRFVTETRKPLEVGKAYPKMITAQLLRNRFYTYPATMMPQFLRWSATNPLGMAMASAATASISGLVWSLLGDDERAARLEELQTARNGAVRWISLTEGQREAYERILRGIPVGPFGQRLPKNTVERARQFWSMLPFVRTDPAMVPMPEHGGEDRVATLAELSPLGYMKNRVRGFQELGAAISGAGGGRGEDAMRGLERLYGVTAQVAIGTAAGILTGEDPMIQALGGKKTMTEALATKLFGLAGRAGVLYPSLGMFTPEGVFIGENVALGGQSWREAARGIVRARDLQGAGGAIASSAARMLWPSRAVYQKPALRAPDDVWTALLSELYGPGFDASTEEGRARAGAARWVNGQMAVLMADLYDIHRSQFGEPGAAEITLDERVFGALRETFEHTAKAGEQYVIQEGYKPEGLLLSAIAGFAPLERSAIVDYLVRWTTRETFWEDGRRWLMEAGNARNIPTGIFREGMMNAFSDPSGTRLLSWWRSEVEKGDEDRMGQLAPLIHDVAEPSSGTRAHDDWSYVLAAYAKKGLRLPPLTEQGQKSVDQLLKERGHAEALQGGPAFEKVLNSRQSPANDVLELLSPR